MTDGELFTFIDVFRAVQRVFGKKMPDGDESQLHRAYFKALRRFSIVQVRAGADVWIQRGKYFPKPAEWIDAIPAPQATRAEVPAMTEADAATYRRAEQQRWEAPPCACAECQRAHVTDKPLRFVPEEHQVRDGDRIVAAGHWAHGYELARWYRARADFYNKFLEAFGQRPELSA